MKGLEDKAGPIARSAAKRRMDELARTIAQRLPRAEIERLTSSISVRDIRLMQRWLDDPELRFMTRSGR